MKRIRQPIGTRTPQVSAERTRGQLESRLRALVALDNGETAVAAAEKAGCSERTIRVWRRQRDALWLELKPLNEVQMANLSRDDQIFQLAWLYAVINFVTESLLTSHSGSRKVVERMQFARLLTIGHRLNKAAAAVSISANTSVNWRNRLDQLEKEAYAELEEMEADGELAGDGLPIVASGLRANLLWAGDVIRWSEIGVPSDDFDFSGVS